MGVIKNCRDYSPAFQRWAFDDIKDQVPPGMTEISVNAYVHELSRSLCLEHERSRTASNFGFARQALAIPWRHRKAKSDKGGCDWRSERPCACTSLSAGNTVGALRQCSC